MYLATLTRKREIKVMIKLSKSFRYKSIILMYPFQFWDFHQSCHDILNEVLGIHIQKHEYLLVRPNTSDCTIVFC